VFYKPKPFIGAFLFLRNMALPYFFVSNLDGKTIVLDEETSKHMSGVLRMTKGEQVLLTNGKGRKATAIIIDDNRKKTVVEIQSLQEDEARNKKLIIGISLIKNSSRFEWFLEKATEIGVEAIVPLLCTRTEKQKFRVERLQHILTSAMLQSQQSRIPELHEPMPFSKAIHFSADQKFIAHCVPGQKNELGKLADPSRDAFLLIGPEGDFTNEEINTATRSGFLPVALGETRLRTETAGVVGATILRMF
jgi:16S rRNA (uracil1498-N3)-methyltransferase